MSSGATLIVSYHTIKKNIKSSIEREVNAEITRYIGDYQSHQIGIAPSQYAFFIEQNGQKIAGNLTKIPLTSDNKLSEVRANVDKPANHKQDNSKVNVLGKTVEIGNTKLFIGKSDYNNTKQQDVLDALISSLVILLLIGTAGGLLISYNATKRIDKISKISKSIMKGDLSLRIPKSKYNDDIEDLTTNLNLMLDKISDLMLNLRQVSNNIAHDLRTPLTRLRGHIETLEKLADTPDTKTESESAIIEIDNMLSTFSALLRIANIESGSASSHFQELDIGKLIDEIIDFYEVLAEEKQQIVTVDNEKDIKIYADKDMITQAIINILTNAIKYTPENGKIDIKTRQINGLAVINIKDSGSGVPDEIIPNLTQHFYRLEEHRANNEGNGLGLALVKAIVKHHKGKLKIYNDNGLNVEINLPKLNN